MQEVGILVIFIKSDEHESGLNCFQIIVGDEPVNFYFCGPSGHGLHERVQICVFLHAHVMICKRSCG